MVSKSDLFARNAVLALALIFLSSVNRVLSDDNQPIPANAAKVESWFKENIGPLESRKATLDPKLVAAEAKPKRITVKASGGGGDFKTITDAIKSIPEGNTNRVIIEIAPGVYKEKVKIDRTKPFITFLGDADDMPTLTYGGTALEYGTVDSASFIVESDYFVAANVIFANSAPRPDGVRKGAQAVAIRVSGDKSAFYNCKLIGFQDTLCDDRGNHFFKDCVIEGTVDFIFGSGTSLYLKTELKVVVEKEGVAVIAAQARQSNAENTGYSFVHCSVTGTKKNVTYLGRSWMPYPRVIYAYTTMGDTVNTLGWSDNNRPDTDKTVFFGEYKNSGPGGEAATRVKFTKQLSESEVAPFIELGFIEGSKWLLPPPA
ncbi:unnamed protein product [Rhodiola kirilowii]